MPKLTVLCITYNHKKFIRETLEGFVCQKTNFPFEVIIGDDGSTDGAPDIIREYAQKYPDIIKPVLRQQNLGAEKNFRDIAARVKSEYVAICEGDDYWTNENKLQKQVDFLDTNPDFSICFHTVRCSYDNGSQSDYIYPCEKERFNKTVLNLDDLLVNNFIQTNSVVYRWRFNESETFEDSLPYDILPGDWYISLLHAQKGEIGFINQTMSVYRKHENSMWWDNYNQSDEFRVKNGPKVIRFLTSLEKNFPKYLQIRGHGYTVKAAKVYFQSCLKLKRFKEMNEIIQLCPDVLNPVITTNV